MGKVHHTGSSQPLAKPPQVKIGPSWGARVLLVNLLIFFVLIPMAPAPALATLEFCNHTSDTSTLSLALAYYHFGTSHARSPNGGSSGLTITIKPRWIVKGWWEIKQNECITAINDDLDQTHYYYYAYSQDYSYTDSGDYKLCGYEHGKFHVEYEISNHKLTQILTLKSSGLHSASVGPEVNLKQACAALGYDLLPFRQLDVEGSNHYTFNFTN